MIGIPQSGVEAILNPHLANPLAVSILLADSQGRWGIVVRSHKTAIASGQWATSAGGTVSPVDLQDPMINPAFSCAVREVREELGLVFHDMTWDGLIIARQKMQPVVLVSGRINRPWKEVLPLIRQARDWPFENAAFYAIPPEHIYSTLRHAPLTDAAAYHLWLHRPYGRPRLFQCVHLHRDRLIAPVHKDYLPHA